MVKVSLMIVKSENGFQNFFSGHTSLKDESRPSSDNFELIKYVPHGRNQSYD